MNGEHFTVAIVMPRVQFCVRRARRGRQPHRALEPSPAKRYRAIAGRVWVVARRPDWRKPRQGADQKCGSVRQMFVDASASSHGELHGPTANVRLEWCPWARPRSRRTIAAHPMADTLVRGWCYSPSGADRQWGPGYRGTAKSLPS